MSMLPFKTLDMEETSLSRCELWSMEDHIQQRYSTINSIRGTSHAV